MTQTLSFTDEFAVGPETYRAGDTFGETSPLTC
jgi:hypothetical protein